MNDQINHQGDKVKSTAHIAKPALTAETGRFALLRGLHRAPGSGAPARGLGAVPFLVRSFIGLCVLAGLIALAATGVVQAEPPRLASDGQFNPHTPLPFGVAVDQSSGDVYVAGAVEPPQTPGHVGKFDASGNVIAPPPPFDEGFDSGVAVNPQSKDVYVLKAFPPAIETFDPSTGAPVGSSFSVPESNNFFFNLFTVVQIAADSAGNVYVPVIPQNEVLEYSPAGALLNTFTGSAGEPLKGPAGVAVDSSGNVWVADSGNNRIVELDSSGAPVEVGGKPVEIESKGVEAVALDGHGDVFAIVKNSADACGSVQSPCPHLVEYDAAGVQVADLGAGSFGAAEATPPSIVAVNEASGRVYVTDAEKEAVWVFAPPAAPVVGGELTSEVRTSEAKLGALVNPGGLETSYRFEYDTREYKPGEGSHGVSVPFPEGSVGEGFVSRTVWAAATGLAPGTTYHYRVVVTSELAPEGVAGPDRTFTTETAAQTACLNEEVRGSFSARLPDCRAYELVIPPAKNSSQPDGGGPSADGNAFTFSTKEPLPGASSAGFTYAATRGPGGWGPAEDLTPLESYSGILCSTSGSNSQVFGYTDEPSAALGEPSRAVVSVGLGSRASGAAAGRPYECNAEGFQVVSGEPVGYGNLLVREGASGGYRLVNAPPPGVTPSDAHFKGTSADLSHVVFTEMAPLAEGAEYGVDNLYEWDEGVVRLLTWLPNGTPASGSLVGKEERLQHAISADGSHILFTSGGGLYDRIGGERTVQIDEKQADAAGSSGGGVFQAASTDGSVVLFLDTSKLTAGATAEAGEPDLYECVLPEGASKCELSDLTVAKAGGHADVLGVSPLGSKDGSHVYFTAKGVLAKGATNGENNLYVYEPDPEHEGQFKTVFIATLSELNTPFVSPDGTWFAFGTKQSLTGYNNSKPGGGHESEVFLYHTATGQLVCASCNPSGEAPHVDAGGVELGSVSNGGRVLFQTPEALVPSDTNGQEDVYEYENGQPILISSGTSAEASTFEGASESGNDVFFESTQALVSQDTQEGGHVIYDARVGGGFPAVAAPPACTTADACRVPVAPLPSVYGAPASATFSGAGSLAPLPPTVVKKVTKKTVRCKRRLAKDKHGKCVRKKSKKKAKRATNDRRGK
jgi:hypothetical protein